ncbi:MAG TPA: MerR family transcriptional regulator, partial [Oscillospiraceae bacterium]|nr:MerR family transcriptional regulator [Oscillospiraceae bacterium]
MLKIGEFSALTGISIHMLRNYDKIGLLKPEQVDGMTGYRFYGERQIVRANHIQVLKDLGFGLKEISEILIGDTLDDRVRTFLESKICEKEESLLTAQKQIA